MKPYHEYTNWMLREFFAHEQDFALDLSVSEDAFLDHTVRTATKISRGKAEELNLTTCAITLRLLPPDQVNLLREVFGFHAQMPTRDAIRFCANTFNIKEKVVWDIVRSVSQSLARTRCLI